MTPPGLQSRVNEIQFNWEISTHISNVTCLLLGGQKGMFVRVRPVKLENKAGPEPPVCDNLCTRPAGWTMTRNGPWNVPLSLEISVEQPPFHRKCKLLSESLPEICHDPLLKVGRGWRVSRFTCFSLPELLSLHCSRALFQQRFRSDVPQQTLCIF